ncbi:protein-cysteine N-palmitoyltransferase HHAT-like [Haliotis asinina]|uniref:protein-cysteine N-palmitoyltransferase HHAT-like n=1 Tax=Haliotis asinina TaxID=109174 RepID=UPI003531A338
MKGSKPGVSCARPVPSSPSHQRYHACLPLPESIFYWVTGIGSIIYTFYIVHQESQKFFISLNKEDFVDGWNILPYKKDISNFEWNFWSSYFWEILPWGIGHVIIARTVDTYCFHLRKPVFLTYSLMSLSYLLGYRTVLFFISHGCICYLASSIGSFLLVWIVSLLLLSTLNYNSFTPWMKHLCAIPSDPTDSGYYFFIFVLALVVLRYTSFCLERSKYVQARANNSHRQNPKEDNCFSIPDLLLYIFYLPIFFTGPLLTYDQFKVQISSPPSCWNTNRILQTLGNFMRVFFWSAFIELSHHFLYHAALLRSPAVMEQVSLWCLLGIGYIEGQYFMVNYLVLYGLPAQVAKLDDIDAPKEPKCISYIYRYSDMWKYFDRGLYTFLRNYIYIPLGGSQAGMLMRLLASMMCFLYIYVWHGQEKYLLLWTMSNFCGCSLELIGSHVEKNVMVIHIKTAYLSPAMVRRVHCALYTPLFLMSVFAVFYFFSGLTVGDIFVRRLVTHASMKTRMLMYGVIYVNIQNAMEIERWAALKTKQHSS